MEQATLKRITDWDGTKNFNPNLVEYRITHRDREWSGWHDERIEDYWCDELHIKNANSLTDFNEKVQIAINKLTH